MKKRWYRSKWAKGICLALGIVSAEVAAVSAGALAGIASMGIYPFDSGTYTESSSLAGELYADSSAILEAIKAGNFLGDGEGLVDLGEVSEGDVLTYENTSGLAYSAGDLQAWAEDGWLDDSTENVLICKKENGEEEYLYYDDFEEKIRSGELRFLIDEDESTAYGYTSSENEYDGKEELLDWLRLRDFTYGTGIRDSYYGAAVTDAEGNLIYEDVMNFEDFAVTEKYSPQGEKSILDVLNENARWKGRIREAYDALSTALNEAALTAQSEKTLEDTFGPGLTNLNYVFADNGGGKLYTNVENMKTADYDSVWKLTEEGKFPYLFLSPREGESNLRTTRSLDVSRWRHLVENYCTDRGDYMFAVWVDPDFPVQDALAENKENYDAYAEWLPMAMAGVASAGILLVVSVIFLTAAAGRTNEDEDVHLNFFDRWYTEIAAVLVIGIWACGVTGVLNFATFQMDVGYVLLFNVLGLWTAFWFFTGWLSLARRIKAGSLWRNSLTRKVLSLAGKVTGIIWKNSKEIAELFSRNTASRIKMTLIFGGFCFFQFVVCGMIFAGGVFFLLLILLAADAAGLLYLLGKARGRELILTGLKKITDGDLQYKIPLEKLTGEQKTIAEYINRIGDGLDAAVENSVKNERMKTELITNVSHDIKTPLTSIINYIDLLKREHPTDPKICGYLDILEEKAQRLKNLTEDVVEASKASTGNISLEMADLNFVELVHQVIGEFEERFREKNLSLMVHFEEEEAIICADGRRMWRVLENVFGNVSKYAMENTRVYAEIRVRGPRVVFSLKNISALPLNISADELTERFIRGDVSRNTEGSGLGLSIAKSLTELQGGEFRLYLDGDLFKVTIIFQVKEKE